MYAELPDSPIILAQLADVEWETGNLNEAVGYFKKAATLRPASETISLGLFHCLWELDRTDEAFDEMRRCVSEHDSDEYATLLREMRTRDGDEKGDNERAVPRDATH